MTHLAQGSNKFGEDFAASEFGGDEEILPVNGLFCERGADKRLCPIDCVGRENATLGSGQFSFRGS